MTDKKIQESPSSGSGWFASGGVLTGLFAFIGASCCVLPIILVNLGVSTALVGNLAFFARAQAWFQWITLALICAGFFFAFRQGRPRPRILILLIIASLFAAGAYILPHYEGTILRWLNL